MRYYKDERQSAWQRARGAALTQRAPVCSKKHNKASSTSSSAPSALSLIWVSSAPRLNSWCLFSEGARFASRCGVIAVRLNTKDGETLSVPSGSHFSAGQHGSKHCSHLSPQETQSTAGRRRAREQEYFETWVSGYAIKMTHIHRNVNNECMYVSTIVVCE